MRCFSLALARGPLWLVVLVTVGIALMAGNLLGRRPAPALAVAPADSTSATEAVVCFGSVDLEHGVTSLLPLQPGRVAEILVRENQAVPAGTELLRLEDRAARSRLLEAEAALKLSRLQLDQARKGPEQKRDRVAQQQSLVDAAGARLAAARQVLAQRQKVGQIPVIHAIDVAASEVHIRELEALARSETLRLAELKARDVDAEIRHAEYDLAVAEARHEQARLALEECSVRASQPGTVLRILVGPGDVLGAERGQPALLFAADGPQVIRTTVEQEFAPRVQEGKAVLVQDEADPAVSYRGHVAQVALWYSQRRPVLHDPSQMSDVRTLECVIVLEPGPPRLRLGQAVRVTIGTVPP
ncbi:Biotin-lipoyl like [Singulisphaera sp. GP187]|uniref:HlyD family secretion protein n=1 Tax=Singulisphaera sp. GP187 TaxID=1882752 RepID=UPI0009277349|nr:biotin/lipoyl-binding protein [Singulisphaera sp. GP187]SIO27556.1 Biotin-lipoyl like [Singulisphaera sp. GP187]